MPNWCTCRLRVTGPEEEIQRFKSSAQGTGDAAATPLSLASLRSLPETLSSAEDLARVWRVTNWGTKWDVDAHLVRDDKEVLEYRFESAWSPPSECFIYVGPQFPELSFQLWYAEGGMAFAGILTVENATVCDEDKEYEAALIEEDGEISVCCNHCDAVVTITDVKALRVCEECLEHRCAHCGKLDDEHAAEKCLFEATQFQSISAEDSP